MDEEDKYITIDVSSLIDSTIDIGSISVSTIAAGDIWLNTNEGKYYVNDGTTWNLSDDVWKARVWEDSFPDFSQVKDMCTEYPALEKAFENFKLIYELTKQDWLGKQKDDSDSSI